MIIVKLLVQSEECSINRFITIFGGEARYTHQESPYQVR